MTVYWISFRIADQTINGKTYEDRYNALTEAIDKQSTRWWVETTSFIVFESGPDIAANARIFKQAISPAADLFLLRSMDSKHAIICGHSEDEDIYSFMPYLKKL